MTLTTESSNIASIPFVAMALQTQEEINASYLRKMNRDYASHIPSTDIPNLYAASESHLSEIQFREPLDQKKCNE
jgi:hypothetical protein